MRKVLSGGRAGALPVLVSLVLAGAGVAAAAVAVIDPFGHHRVGQTVHGAILLPTNQWISPIGKRTIVRNGRLLSSSLSPDGTKLAALTWNNFVGYLTIMDVRSGRIIQQVGTGVGADAALGDSTVAADGPVYSHDGRTLWFPQAADLVRFTVDPATGTVSNPVTIKLSGPQGAALPSGMALSADDSRLYVALNGNNTLGIIDTTTNELVRELPTFVAPRQVVLDGNLAYVSDEGGRPPSAGEPSNVTDLSKVVADRRTGAATSGRVTVLNVLTGQRVTDIHTGLQPTAMLLRGRALFVADSNNDTVDVVDTSKNLVVQAIHTNPVPGASVGSSANALAMPNARTLLVSIGRDNAIAVYDYRGLTTPAKFLGLIPTDWYPVGVESDPALGNQIIVTNDKGIGARGPQATIDEKSHTSPAAGKVTGNNTYDDTGSITQFFMPTGKALTALTKVVFTDNAWNAIPRINAGAGDTVPTVIPRRIGGKSPIKHVFVIIKENRTYDQVLGDLGSGNGARSLAQFGEGVTPNLHALARRFGNYDNFYDAGTLSADGHNWIDQGNANDYVEKEFGAFYRSYPAQGGDALAYQRDGFLWNAAQRAHKTVRAYGEYANFFTVPNTGGPTWNDWYKDSRILEGKASGPLPVPIDKYRTYSDIPSLNGILNPFYPKFNLDVPDQYRVDIWRRDFVKAQRTGRLANLNLLWVPDDHTSGSKGDPLPVASVADNDLAVGRIVQTITHSRFWKSSAIFVLEDDPQNGVDHVDGHRSVLWVISPWSKRGVHDLYHSQLNVVRTVEQILGIHPMNQMDQAAEPMYDAFQRKPNFAPYNAKPNRIPLTLGAPGYPAAADVTGAAAVPAAERGVVKAWYAWSRNERFSGANALEDFAKPALLNRLDWYSSHGWREAYPGDPQIYAPNQVPARALMAGDHDG